MRFLNGKFKISLCGVGGNASFQGKPVCNPIIQGWILYFIPSFIMHGLAISKMLLRLVVNIYYQICSNDNLLTSHGPISHMVEKHCVDVSWIWLA